MDSDCWQPLLAVEERLLKHMAALLLNLKSISPQLLNKVVHSHKVKDLHHKAASFLTKHKALLLKAGSLQTKAVSLKALLLKAKAQLCLPQVMCTQKTIRQGDIQAVMYLSATGLVQVANLMKAKKVSTKKETTIRCIDGLTKRDPPMRQIIGLKTNPVIPINVIDGLIRKEPRMRLCMLPKKTERLLLNILVKIRMEISKSKKVTDLKARKGVKIRVMARKIILLFSQSSMPSKEVKVALFILQIVLSPSLISVPTLDLSMISYYHYF